MKKFIVPIILLALILSILLAGGMWMVFAQSTATPPEEVAKEEKTKSSKSSKKAERIFVALGDSFITNAADNKSCLIKMNITLELSDKKMAELLGKEDVVVRDAVIRILRSKTTEQMCAVDAQDVLSTEFCEKLNELYETDSIVNANISEFIVQ